MLQTTVSEMPTPEIESHCRQLFRSAEGVFSLLMNNPIANAKKPDADPSLQNAVTYIEHIEKELNEFAVSTIAVQPRTIRDADVKKLSSGEHAGVTAEYTDPAETIVRINFFGGLRDPFSHSDEHDADTALRNSHAKRTDDIASKSTHVNIQMQDSGSEELQFDIWFTVNQTQSKLSSLIVDGNKLDLVSTVNTSQNTENPAGNIFHKLRSAIRHASYR